MLVRLAAIIAVLVSCFVSTVPGFAQTATTPGQFDFYILSLSWSPSYCAAIGNQRQDPQCSKSLGFVVHGLWPEKGNGTPVVCERTDVRLPQALIKDQLDIFPSPGLVIHEWRTHGACSGLDPAGFFAAVHKAFAGLTVPASYSHIDQSQMADTSAIARDFITANKGLDASEISVVCNRQGLEDVRICINKDLKTFHPCAEVTGNSCKSPKVYMPAIHTAN